MPNPEEREALATLAEEGDRRGWWASFGDVLGSAPCSAGSDRRGSTAVEVARGRLVPVDVIWPRGAARDL
ncbi:hypothetical protein AB0I72_21935 [Nocardiopsis sp. NPDC049922]|uniref:hypothetical protein n=1 Tax=Nocardiopsis sp. NPDC049922 TaxID=3155157 RepID=UPI0033DB493B